MKSEKKLINEQQQSLYIWTYCPTTGRQVEGSYRQHFSIRGGQFTWWYCSNCQNWHASIIDI